MNCRFEGREAAPPARAGVGVGGQALRYTQRRCGAVKVESEADLDGPQNPPEGGEAPLRIKVRPWK
jgi:hypothetical protein